MFVLNIDEGDAARKVDMRLPEKGDPNSHGARPVNETHIDVLVELDQWVVNKELSLVFVVTYQRPWYLSIKNSRERLSINN